MDDDFKITAQELPGAIEAILFVSGDPVSIDKLADILNCSKNAVAFAKEDPRQDVRPEAVSAFITGIL